MRLFPLGLKGNDFGAGEKLVGSTICRLLTRTGTAHSSAGAQVLHLQGKYGTKGTWKKCSIRHGCASASGWLFRGFSGCFRIPQQCCVRGRRETRGAGGTSQGYRWAHGDVLLCRHFAAWRWRSGQCLEFVLNPQTCPSSLSQHTPLLSQIAELALSCVYSRLFSLCAEETL